MKKMVLQVYYNTKVKFLIQKDFSFQGKLNGNPNEKSNGKLNEKPTGKPSGKPTGKVSGNQIDDKRHHNGTRTTNKGAPGNGTRKGGPTPKPTSKFVQFRSGI